MNRRVPQNGFTLIEISIVLMLMIALLGLSMFVSRAYQEWQLARTAAEELHTVYVAQRMFLADNPTTTVSAITDSQIIPYLTGNLTALPTVTSLEDQTLSIRVDVSPPVIDDGSGGTYDPSGSSNDSLWDVGL
ncbi:MAG: type II secretion system protein [Luteolibacter sp.]